MITVRILLLITLALLTSTGAALAEPFYILNGSALSKVERGRTEEVRNVLYWEYRLYKRGAARGGNDFWGVMSGRTPESLREELEEYQQHERNSSSASNDTFFNPLGPIAVINRLKSGTARQSLSLLNDARENAGTFMSKYRAINRLLAREAGYNNPFRGMGMVLGEYAANFIDVHKKQKILLEEFAKHGGNLALFRSAVGEFERNLESYRPVQSQVGAWLNDPGNSYASGRSSNDKKAGFTGGGQSTSDDNSAARAALDQGARESSDKCGDRREGTFKVSATGSDRMYLDTSINAYVCKRLDAPAFFGQNLCIENNSRNCPADYTADTVSGTLQPQEKKVIPIPFDNGPRQTIPTIYRVNLHYVKE